MTSFDATTATINANDISRLVSPTPNRDANDVAVTRVSRCASNGGRTEGASGDAPKRHDGQLPSPSPLLDV
jgi:hypothetical protein